MIKISIKCFHEAPKFSESTAHEMNPTNILEFETITFKCPVCGHEVIVKMEIEDHDL